MEKVKYTETSQSYSRLIAGCMRWGAWGAKFSKEAYQKQIENCLAMGISSFDHADFYGDYTTEEEFGTAISAMEINRSSVQYITKCGIRMLSDNRPLNKLKSYDCSGAYIIESVEQSLRNLQTDYIDLLLLHRPSPLLQPEEVARAFEELKQSGKVLDFGVSNFASSKFDLLHSYFPLVTNQLELSTIKLESFTDGTLDNLMLHKIKPQAWSPMGGARLFATQNKLEDTERVMRLQSVCGDYDWSLAQMSLLFLLHHPAAISPILGTTNDSHLEEAVRTLDMKITTEQWFEIWTASTGTKVA